jgi:putative DNA primase/helicase
MIDNSSDKSNPPFTVKLMSELKRAGPLPVEPQHIKDLRLSGISHDTIRESGLYSEKDPVKIGRLLNWDGPARNLGSCLVFPYPAPDGSPSGYHRLKPDRRRIDKKGKEHKYEAPWDKGNHLYFPPGTLSVLSAVSAPLVIAEGEKKALKADQEGFPTIALSGVDCGMKDGKLIADFDAIPWRGRTVFICFDSDVATNVNVQWAEWRLAQALKKLGADVRAVRLPEAEGAEP